MVFEPRDERVFFAADQEPMVAVIRFKAAESLPLSIGDSEVIFKEVLAKLAPGEAHRVVVGGS